MGTSVRWYQKRPIPVWIILALYSIQMVGIFVAMHDARYLDQIAEGTVSPIKAIASFVYPLLMFTGAVFLFLNRRVALVFFVTHIIIGFVRLLHGVSLFENVSEAIAIGIFIYSLRFFHVGKRSGAQQGAQADRPEEAGPAA